MSARWSRILTRLLPLLLILGLLGFGSAETAIALGSPVLISITVSPVTASVAQGDTEQFTATGIYSDLSTVDLTNSVDWASSSTATATISNSAGSQGLATGTSTGLATITANDPSSLIQGTAALTVTPVVLVSITVSPAAAAVQQDGFQQFTATGIYSDLSTQDLTDTVTWSSSSTGTATVSNSPGFQGFAAAQGTGVATITAKDPSALIQGTAVLTVTPASGPSPSPSLTLTPSSGKHKTPIVVDGSNFEPGQDVTVVYESGLRSPKRAYTVLCTNEIEPNGKFACTAKIPGLVRSGKRGSHSVVAEEGSYPSATATFTIPPRSKREPAITQASTLEGGTATTQTPPKGTKRPARAVVSGRRAGHKRSELRRSTPDRPGPHILRLRPSSGPGGRGHKPSH